MSSAVAIIVGGAECVWDDFAVARALVDSVGGEVMVYATNDMIAMLPGVVTAVTLHVDKLPGWLKARTAAGYPSPSTVWANRMRSGIVTGLSEDWGGSVGLFAAKIAFRHCGHTKVILAGVPMEVRANHFVRKRPWNACSSFRKGWERHRADMAPYVKSLSGWTADQLGRPSAEWLCDRADP